MCFLRLIFGTEFWMEHGFFSNNTFSQKQKTLDRILNVNFAFSTKKVNFAEKHGFFLGWFHIFVFSLHPNYQISKSLSSQKISLKLLNSNDNEKWNFMIVILKCFQLKIIFISFLVNWMFMKLNNIKNRIKEIVVKIQWKKMQL